MSYPAQAEGLVNSTFPVNTIIYYQYLIVHTPTMKKKSKVLLLWTSKGFGRKTRTRVYMEQRYINESIIQHR